MNKVFVEIGYYEIYIRPRRKDDKPSYYQAVGGLFNKHKNSFRNVRTCLNLVCSHNKFNDHVFVHSDLAIDLVGTSWEHYIPEAIINHNGEQYMQFI